MTEIRCKPGDMTLASDSSWQFHHEHRTTLPIKDILTDIYFMNVRGNLHAGDLIRICRYQDQTWRRVIEVAEVRVIEVTNAAVRLHLLGQIEAIDAPKAEAPKPAEPPREQYATTSGWKAVHLHFGKWNVLNETGAVVASGLDKETAHSVARGDLPVPAKEAA